MARFLAFVVDTWLDGEIEALKETAIGVAVFDRSPDYNPKLDPVVRNEARRLRAKLEEYYAQEGCAEKLRIGIPKGGYVPSFDGEWQAPVAVEAESPPVAEDSRGPRRMWIGAVALVALGALAGVWWRNESPVRDFSGLTISQLTSDPAREVHPAVSPDGREVAFVWDRAGQYDVYRLGLDGEPEQLTRTAANELHPSWSPDGRSLAFLRVSGQGYDLVVLRGAQERVVGRLDLQGFGAPMENVLLMHGNPGPAWAGDGESLVVTRGVAGQWGYPLHVLRIRDGADRQLTHPGGAAHDFHPAVSPDGKWVAFARWLTNSTSQLYVVPFGGGPERRVTAEHADIKGIAWRDERSLIISSNRKGPHQLWMVPLEGGVPVLVPTTGVSAQEPSLSRDGSTLVYSDLTLESEIWAGPPSGGLRRIVASTRQNHSAQFSPDGSRIAYVSNSSGSWEVWTAGADGAGPRQLTKFGGPLLGTVHWSPDGKSLAFDARPKGYSQIFIMNADGAGLRPVNRNNAEEKMPNFSRDGKWIYFNSNRDGAQRLWKKSLVSGEELRLAENFATDSAESVDGRTVYFLSRGPGIYEVAASGGQARLAPGLADANPRRVWAVDQKGIWYLNPGIGTLMLFSLEARSARAVLPLTRPVADTPSLSVFGDQLVFAREGLSRSDLMIARHLNR